MARTIDLSSYGLTQPEVTRNPAPARLYEAAIVQEDGEITSTGALAALSGAKTGRSPTDKRIVDDAAVTDDVWWGEVNVKLEDSAFLENRQRAIDFLNSRRELYVVDGFAGWDPARRIKVRVICARAYHALFMHNMLIRPSEQELLDFGEPSYVIFNAGQFPADPNTAGLTSPTSVALSFERGEFVILGTEYAGEMKKGVFTIMNYLMPRNGVLSMHCSANEGEEGDVSLFFGLSGTGKTTLSADPGRQLIGDDEHCWTDDGVFNIEGGCYAKCIDLSAEKEPLIHQAIRFGSVLENVVYDEETREVDYTAATLTQNTRASYPIESIPNAKIPCVGGHPTNIFLLTCDAFGVLPPVSRLTPAQAMYHFISGYTAKVAGTEVGVTEPQANFSACFGAPFLVCNPQVYAELLAEKMRRFGAKAWLVNTGWTGGGYGEGSRIPLEYTRAIINAVHAGDLDGVQVESDPLFGIEVPTRVPGIPDEILVPARTWKNAAAYRSAASDLAQRFDTNFSRYANSSSAEVLAGGPQRAEEEAVR